MSYQSALIALRFVFFFTTLFLVYMMYESRFSLDAIVGATLGVSIGSIFNILEGRKTTQSTHRIQHAQNQEWVMWGPFLGMLILGVVRLFANQNVLLLVGVAGGCAFLTIVGKIIFFNTKTSDSSNLSQDHEQQHHREHKDWKARQKQLRQEESAWREEQRRRRQR